VVSGATGVVALRQERLFPYAQPKPPSQEPTEGDAPHPSSKEGKRVLEPIAEAATWSADIPSNTSGPVVLLGATPVKYVALAAAWSPGAISPLRWARPVSTSVSSRNGSSGFRMRGNSK